MFYWQMHFFFKVNAVFYVTQQSNGFCGQTAITALWLNIFLLCNVLLGERPKHTNAIVLR